MKYVRWALMMPVMLALTVLTFPLAFVLPLFATERQGVTDNSTSWGWGYWLPSWLSWFQTPDNGLDGDYGWKTEHWQWRFKLPKGLCQYVGMVGWLWRNPAYGFGVERVPVPQAAILTGLVSGNPDVNDSPLVEGSFYVEMAGLWQYVYVKRITATHCIYLNLGWNIKGALEGPQRVHIASFAFSPRIAKVG